MEIKEFYEKFGDCLPQFYTLKDEFHNSKEDLFYLHCGRGYLIVGTGGDNAKYMRCYKETTSENISKKVFNELSHNSTRDVFINPVVQASLSKEEKLNETRLRKIALELDEGFRKVFVLETKEEKIEEECEGIIALIGNVGYPLEEKDLKKVPYCNFKDLMIGVNTSSMIPLIDILSIERKEKADLKASHNQEENLEGGE